MPLTIVDAPSVQQLGIPDDAVEAYFWLHERWEAVWGEVPQEHLDALSRLAELGLVKRETDRTAIVSPLSVNPDGDRWETLLTTRSPYQLIELKGRGDATVLYLNGEIQCHSVDDRGSHELMVRVPLDLAISPKRVLILGGGDGLAARQALLCDSVELVRIVELCPGMVEMARSHDAMRRLNGDAFHDPRSDVIIGDALAYVFGSREHFDVVVDDCEFSATDQPEHGQQRYIDYLRALEGRLTDTGVGCIMTPLCQETRDGLAPFARALGLDVGLVDQGGSVVGQLQSLEAELWSHTRHHLYRSAYLDAELFTYFSKRPI